MLFRSHYDYAIATYINPAGQPFNIILDYHGNGVFSGYELINQYGLAGEYTLSLIRFESNWNSFWVFDESLHPIAADKADLQTANFVTEGTIFDDEYPVLHSMSIESNVIGPGGYVNISFDISDLISGIASFRICIENPDQNSSCYHFNGTNNYQFSYYVWAYAMEGSYRIKSFEITDNFGNVSVYVDREPETTNEFYFDFSAISFEVVGTLPYPTRPTIESLTQSNPVIDGGGSTTLTLVVAEKDQDYVSATINYNGSISGGKSVYLNYLGNGVFEGTFYLSNNETSQDYTFHYLQISHQGTHFEYYQQDYDFSNINVSLINTSPDFEGPVLVSAYSTVKTVGINDLTHVIFEFADENEITQIEYKMLTPTGDRVSYWAQYLGNGIYQVEITPHRFMSPGDYIVEYIKVYDTFWNSRTYTSNTDDYPEAEYMDFSSTRFSVVGTQNPPSAPTIQIGRASCRVRV